MKNLKKIIKALATDETYKTPKKELQLLFLNQVQSEVEKSGTVTSNKFLDILTKQEFSAKEDFLKGFVQKIAADDRLQVCSQQNSISPGEQMRCPHSLEQFQ